MKNLLLVTITLLFLTGCQSSTKSPIVAVWQVELIEVNGSEIDGSNMGKWQWEFNSAGGYMINLSGEKEKGKYNSKDNKLTLKSTTNLDKPETVYDLVKVDSAELVLQPISENNKSTIHFIRIGDSDPKLDK
jgi:hypothetical protein